MAAILKAPSPAHDTPFISTTLAEFAAGFDYAAIPARVTIRAKYLMLDALGIAFASTRFDFAHRAHSAVIELGGAGPIPVIGFGSRLPLRDAVLMNGILVHGLDYDDTHVPGVLHATASAFPCALGVAASTNASGRDMLAAYVLGVEVSARLGAVAKGAFHQVGFHPTGLIGAFGCALAAGYLRGMNAAQLAMAQGIALSMASGSLEFLEDGAWTKRMHPGWAGVAGITAATLARHGFVGAARTYEGRFGLYASHLGSELANCDFELATRGLGEQWELDEIAIKPYPTCHFTHGCAEAAIALSEGGINPADVVRIRARVPQEVVKTVCEPVANKRRPANEYDAKFSIPYVVATSLLRGRFGLAELEEPALRDAATLALADKVDYEVDPESGFPKYYSGEVVALMKDGGEVRRRVPVNLGASDRPIDNAAIEAKYFANAGQCLSHARARRVRDALLDIDSMPDVGAVAALLCGA